MLSFIPVFLFTLLFLIALVLLLAFGRPPAYRPTRQSVRELMAGVLERSTAVERWEMFLSLPVVHDPELEGIRRRCLALHEGTDDQPPAGEGLDGYIYDRASRARLQTILGDLDELIRKEPVSREF